MSDRVPAVLVVVVAALFVAGVMSAAFEDTLLATGDRRPAARTADTAPADFDTVKADIRQVVPALQRFVEKERGLRFKKDVNVTLLDDASFRARIGEDTEQDLEQVDETSRVLRALGLLDAHVDLEDAREDVLGQAVAGFYDPDTEELVVRGVRATALVRRVLVHELTHALQDQHFELHRPDLDDREDEAGLAFSALVEGDAVRVEEAFEKQLSDADRRAAEQEEKAQTEGLLDDEGIPQVLLQFLAFPYAFGPAFVRALLDDGGQARLDAAFAEPPTTSEQILDPRRFIDGHDGERVPPPPAEGEVFDEGVLGQYGLYVILSDQLLPRVAARAAQGWGGDWYVAWRDGDETCVRATILMDSQNDRAELRTALNRWAEDHGDVEVDESRQRTTLTACG